MKTTLLSLVLLTSQINIFAAQSAQDFVAHEWGTFTSVQGADGIQIEWNPLVTTELPGFVYDRNRPNGVGRAQRFSDVSSKSAFVTLQRMETPVIYFYSPVERTVDVEVKFPQGIITEWYPQIAHLSSSEKSDIALRQQNGVRWSGVKILPQALNQTLAQRLPQDKSGSHYYAARQTEADVLQISPTGSSKIEQEKFLFYRGVASFRAPLEVTLGSSEQFITVKNTGAEPLAELFVLNVRKSTDSKLVGKFLSLPALAPGQNTTVKLNPLNETMGLGELRPLIMGRMQKSLVAQGLYNEEASAMVHTWEDSWFGEEGLRVLYVLPRKWTDQILPIDINPPPSELVRVMVGRAEVITPGMEWQLLKQIVKFNESDVSTRQEVALETQRLGLGRFAEPAVRRILGKTPSREFSEQAWNLLQATKTLPNQARALADASP